MGEIEVPGLFWLAAAPVILCWGALSLARWASRASSRGSYTRDGREVRR